MLASQSDIRSRIEDLKLTYGGYSRQLKSLDLTSQRRERLQIDLRILEDEIEALGVVTQIGRTEPDRQRVEAAVRERLAEVRAGLAGDANLAGQSADELDLTSGEARALRWVLGEEPEAQRAASMVEGHERANPDRMESALPSVLTRMLTNGPNVEARASAAYELGKLGLSQAITDLVAALDDEPLVAQMALDALCRFSDEEVRAARTNEEVFALVATERARRATS